MSGRRKRYKGHERHIVTVPYEDMREHVIDMEKRDRWVIDSPREVISIIIENSRYSHIDADYDHSATIEVLSNSIQYLGKRSDALDPRNISEQTTASLDEVMNLFHEVCREEGIDIMCVRKHEWIAFDILVFFVVDIPF